jgi:hypothetical protein
VSTRRLIPLLFIILLAVAACRVWTVSAGDEWQPITPEELKMTSEPQAPGAPAIYLYRQVDRDDQGAHEYNYLRIKILTEEGRKQGDVEIPFVKDQANIRGIKARTIRPDGSVANFDGKIYEKTVIKAKGLKYLAKTFTFPDVQVGSIIEYRYTTEWNPNMYFSESHWILSEELFTKRAKFSLKPVSSIALRWSWPMGLPQGTNAPKNEGGTIRLETQNVPAFQIEDYMPPENELKTRVDFVYNADNEEKEADKFWKKEGKSRNEKVEAFVGKRKAMEQAVAGIISASDAPEAKLQKIYARVQQVRNTSAEAEKTEQEQKREKLREINNVEDVWKQGMGDGRAITWLYLGLVRAAGFEAYPVLVSRRNEYFFNAKFMNPGELNDNVVLVKLNGKDIYCDPGTAFTPYGLLPWAETGVQGLRLDKEGGSWVTTTLPESATSRIERKADLKLTSEGGLEGKLTITFSGLEALWRRIEERNEDEANRKKFLEDQVKEYIPVGIDVELKNKPNWSSSAPTLVAEFELKITGWASGAGRRALVPVGLFSATEKHLFDHASRVHPIYFQFPFQKADDVTMELPLGWQVNSLPAAQNQNGRVVEYTLKVENDKGTLHLVRTLNVDLVTLQTQYYTALRKFFEQVRTGDEEQIVLLPDGTAASN